MRTSRVVLRLARRTARTPTRTPNPRRSPRRRTRSATYEHLRSDRERHRALRARGERAPRARRAADRADERGEIPPRGRAAVSDSGREGSHRASAGARRSGRASGFPSSWRLHRARPGSLRTFNAPERRTRGASTSEKLKHLRHMYGMGRGPDEPRPPSPSEERAQQLARANRETLEHMKAEQAAKAPASADDFLPDRTLAQLGGKRNARPAREYTDA